MQDKRAAASAVFMEVRRRSDMKKNRILLAAAMLGVLLTGCAGGNSSSTFEPSESSIYVTREGGISSALIRTYENENYEQSELQAFAQQLVTDYNSANGENAVTLKNCTLGSGKASLVFDYKSGKDLSLFATENENAGNIVDNLEVTSVADGLVQGKIVDASFTKVKDGKKVDSDTVTKDGELHLVTVEGPGVVLQTEGKPQYISEGVTVTGDFTVKTPEGKSYIVFK